MLAVMAFAVTTSLDKEPSAAGIEAEVPETKFVPWMITGTFVEPLAIVAAVVLTVKDEIVGVASSVMLNDATEPLLAVRVTVMPPAVLPATPVKVTVTTEVEPVAYAAAQVVVPLDAVDDPSPAIAQVKVAVEAKPEVVKFDVVVAVLAKTLIEAGDAAVMLGATTVTAEANGAL